MNIPCIGERQFEHVFCQIDSNGRSIHGGLLSLVN